jgi:hypothetical protein
MTIHDFHVKRHGQIYFIFQAQLEEFRSCLVDDSHSPSLLLLSEGLHLAMLMVGDPHVHEQANSSDDSGSVK